MKKIDEVNKKKMLEREIEEGWKRKEHELEVKKTQRNQKILKDN